MKQSFQSSLKQTTSFTPLQQQAVKIPQLNATALAQEIQQFADLEAALSITKLRQARSHLQKPAPSGIGCWTLSECLTIQLDALTSKQVEVAHGRVAANDKGIHVARRSVAKYREQLNIPASSIRKHLSNP